jgi:hypothetical protein
MVNSVVRKRPYTAEKILRNVGVYNVVINFT